MNDELKPCPFCGGPAKFSVCPMEITLESGTKIENPNAGGEYIECVSSRCGVETMLIFPTMADAKPLLAEIWNRRALQSHPTAERELAEANKEVLRVTELHKGLMAHADERYHQALDKLAEAKRDAERIDWLEENVSAIRDIGWLGGSIRAAIDAAIHAKEG